MDRKSALCPSSVTQTRHPRRRALTSPPLPFPRARFIRSIPEYIGGEIEKACHGIFPLQNVYIRKVKMLKKPKFDLTKLMEMYGDGAEDTGRAVAASEEPAVETMAGSGGRL